MVRRLLFIWGVVTAVLAQEPAATPELDNAAAVRALAPEAAALRRAVRLRGNLLYITASRTALVLLDRTDGIYVELGRQVRPGLQLGDELEVRGESDAGDFAPIVRARSVDRVGPGVLPPPRSTTIADVSAGGFDAAWVELRGIVRACRPAPPDRLPSTRTSSILTFAQGDDKIDVRIEGPVEPAELVDAEVRLRGVVFNVHNANRQFVRASVQVAGRGMVEVIATPPADPFALPLQRVSEVLRFSRSGFTGRRVHVQGVVTGHINGSTLWLREGERGMRVASAQNDSLVPGDVVDVVGFPDHGSYTPSLSDAVFRKISPGPAPAPLALKNPEDISRDDANLVQLEAELRELRSVGESLELVLNWNGLEVRARLAKPPAGAAAAAKPPAGAAATAATAWPAGSVVRVAGICIAGQTDFSRSTGLWVATDLQLWLRSPDDVTVIRGAPWLTSRRAMGALFAIALAALISVAVLAAVARRQIAQREVGRKLAEAEFAAMLAERNRLAREIHDTLAQDLNAASMQLELAKNATKAGGAETAAQFLAAAHQIVRQCLTSARDSIWDMRSHILERQDLVGAIQSVAEQLRGGMDCEIRVRVEGRPRRLAPTVENDLLRIGQEAVSNALKHAQARAIDLEFRFDETTVRLAVSDNGRGFDPGSAPPAAEGHFGLRGMHERVARIGGKLTIVSRAEGGTRVEVVVEAPRPP